MKSLFWKFWIPVLALGLLLVLGAFAEGTISLPSAAVCLLAGTQGIRLSWAFALRAEARAAARRARAQSARRRAAARPASDPVRGPLRAA